MKGKNEKKSKYSFKHITNWTTFKALEIKEKKSDGHIDICSKKNEYFFNNVIENISIDHITNTSTNILSPNKIHEEIDVQFKRQQKKSLSTKNVSFFLVNNEKINSSHKNILRYKENVEDIVGHVCYCCQRLHFIYQLFVASKSYIEKFPHELKNAITMQDILYVNLVKRNSTLKNLLTSFYKIIP